MGAPKASAAACRSGGPGECVRATAARSRGLAIATHISIAPITDPQVGQSGAQGRDVVQLPILERLRSVS